MANSFFQFKTFTIQQSRCAMKVTTDACLFGAWVARDHPNKNNGVEKVLDIGTGSGLLSLMFAQVSPLAKITAIEIDEECVTQARDNSNTSLYADRINIMHGDVTQLAFQEKFDLIISNPPFYENEILSADPQKNIAHHSARLSLANLLVSIKNNLQPSGVFYLLLPFKRRRDIQSLISKYRFRIDKMVQVKPSPNHDYFRLMIKAAHSGETTSEPLIQELVINDERAQYTKEFTALLKDYYLKL